MLQLVGKKIGMTHMFKENGISIPLTMLQVYDNCVIDLTVNEDKEFDSLLVAFNKTEKSSWCIANGICFEYQTSDGVAALTQTDFKRI